MVATLVVSRENALGKDGEDAGARGINENSLEKN
jgi:hypothetical protein